jgi:hypothetical protein
MTVSPRADPAFPKVSLPDLDGTSRAVLNASPGSRSLIVIGHSECGTTRLLVPYLKRMHDRRTPGTSVILVLQDGPEAARAFLSELEAADLPVRLEPAPYPLSSELQLATVPTLFLVSGAGAIEQGSEGFQRAAIEDLAQRIGVRPPFFLPDDKAPALRPG